MRGAVASQPALRRLLLLTALGVWAVDQASKWLAVAKLEPDVPRTVIPTVLQLRLIRNPGAAFSLSTGTTWFFTVVAIVVGVMILRAARRVGSPAWAAALGLVLGGAIGNLTDRLLRQPGFGQGHVVDFIEWLRFPVIDFPIFNLADSAIVVAAGVIAVLSFRQVPFDGRTSTIGEHQQTGDSGADSR